ncbi:hypothetical protein [Streptomyces sp. RFCAC02]|uniref:hypothetical protein n=1 Tax=Streptomyces sp. RFCAC02 TaxID=2499143 RepID=UPI00101EF5E0|nr:hypothetical protein [Streptomyces sp. RFCAC02]
MRGAHRTAGTLVGLVGAALSVAGPVMLWRGRGGRREIRGELAAQRITFPVRDLPPGLAGHAGRRVATGPEAHAYAELIKDHLIHITDGRSYAEITDELQAGGGDDESLTRLRQTAFMGESLRASLMSAYQAWHVTTLAMGLGSLLAGTGAALLVTGKLLVSDGTGRG